MTGFVDTVCNWFSPDSSPRKNNDTRLIDKRPENGQAMESETNDPDVSFTLHGHKISTTGKEQFESPEPGIATTDHNPSEKHCDNCEHQQREVTRLEKRAADLENQLKFTQSELAETQQDCAQAAKSARHIRKKYDAHKDSIKRLLSDLESVDQQYRDADGKRKESEGKNMRLQEKLRVYEHEYKQMAQLLEERTADIKGAQMFLTAADLHSGADIINMVEELNERIFQLAAFAAELVEDETMVASQTERDLNMQASKKWLDLLSCCTAPEIYTYLAGDPSQARDNPMPLQLLLQQHITSWCTRESRIIHPGLEDLYNAIKLQETQAVTGRWRALSSLGLSREGQNSSKGILFLTIVAALYLCGWSSSKAAEAEKMKETIGKMVSGIEKQQRRLERAITQEVTTADMDLFIFKQGASFLQDEMENDYKEVRGSVGSVDSATQVLCTVGMGLQKSVTNKGQRETSLLVKAKVVLNTIVQDFGSTME